MLIYNVTTQVAWPVHESWLSWMQQTHIPEVMQTGCFQQSQLVRLLETDETEGPTYAVQYYAANEDQYRRYISDFSAELRKRTLEQWGNSVIAFRSLMKIIA